MANVKISNLPVETTLANMTGIAGYNAAGTAQISGATIDSAFAKSTSDLQFIVDNGNIIDSNGGTGSILFKNGASNTITTMSVNSISSDTSFSIIGTTTNTNLTLTSGGNLRITPNASLGTPAVGDVLAAKNTLGDVEWISAGGSTPDIQTVVNAGGNSVINDQGGNRSFIDFREGNTTSQFSVGKDPAGTFGIRVGQGNFSLQGATSGTIFLQTGISGQKRISLTDSTSGNAVAELTSQMDLRLSPTSAFKCGGSASSGTSGQVLTSTGTSVEWTTPSAPINSLTPSNAGDLDMFDDGVVRLWWDTSASDIELEITNQGGGSGSTASVYHASYTSFDGTSTTTTTTDFNANNATTTGTLDFNFTTDEVMILRLWTPDASLQPGFGYYEVTFTKSSTLYTGVPILCSVRKSSF